MMPSFRPRAALRGVTLFASVLLFTVACESREPAQQIGAGSGAAEPAAQPAQPAPAAAPAAAMPAPAADAPVAFTGRVGETMDAGGYTYARLELPDGSSRWVAGPTTELAVGDQVTVRQSMVMENFASPTLGRTFERIDFASALEVAGAADAGTAPAPPPADTAAAVEPVEKLPDGQTVAEVIAQGEALAGKPVAVRGRVVKFNPGILGTNWIHIQDGTGDATTGDNDLTVTAPGVDKLAIGDVIEVRGTVAVNRDFGAGYSYPVLVEDAEVTVAP